MSGIGWSNVREELTKWLLGDFLSIINFEILVILGDRNVGNIHLIRKGLGSIIHFENEKPIDIKFNFVATFFVRFVNTLPIS